MSFSGGSGPQEAAVSVQPQGVLVDRGSQDPDPSTVPLLHDVPLGITEDPTARSQAPLFGVPDGRVQADLAIVPPAPTSRTKRAVVESLVGGAGVMVVELLRNYAVESVRHALPPVAWFILDGAAFLAGAWVSGEVMSERDRRAQNAHIRSLQAETVTVFDRGVRNPLEAAQGYVAPPSGPFK